MPPPPAPLELHVAEAAHGSDAPAPVSNAQVTVTSKEVRTRDPILFDKDHARVHHAFYPILENVATALAAHPEITRLRIDGYADASGPEAWNDELSSLRAQAVVDWLVAHGVSRDRLVAAGRGEARPGVVDPADRRVTFTIEVTP